MDITPLVKEGQQVIQSYSAGYFRVSGQLYEAAILVMPDETVIWDIQKKIDEAMPDDLSGLLAYLSDIDVLLLGCGERMVRVNAAIQKFMKDHGVALEVMDSAAACRTYNVLMAEGRRVAAALIPV